MLWKASLTRDGLCSFIINYWQSALMVYGVHALFFLIQNVLIHFNFQPTKLKQDRGCNLRCTFKSLLRPTQQGNSWSHFTLRQSITYYVASTWGIWNNVNQISGGGGKRGSVSASCFGTLLTSLTVLWNCVFFFLSSLTERTITENLNIFYCKYQRLCKDLFFNYKRKSDELMKASSRTMTKKLL